MHVNVVTRALTQNLRNIRTNWAGSAGWLRLVGTCLLVMLGMALLGGWARVLVLDGHQDGSRSLLAQAVGAIFFGGSVAIPWILIMRIRRPFRSLPFMWFLFSMSGFIANVDLPYSAGTSFAIQIVALGFLTGIVMLFRAPLRKYFGPRDDEKKSRTS